MTKRLSCAAVLLFSSAVFAQDELDADDEAVDEVIRTKTDISNINNEVFELGLFAGVINIEDFGSEFAPGISATFRASEDFFIQYNYLQASVGLSSYEQGTGVNYFTGGDRDFVHYDLLVGYNLFQGEFFPSPPKASLSTLYLVAGVGDTEFGGESKITYTVGVGYQVALTRRFAIHFDFRDYIYKSTVISTDERQVQTTQISSGLKFAF